MTFSDKDAFRAFERSVRLTYRYARTPEQTAFLEAIGSTCKNRIRTLDAGATLYRAQLGHGWRREKIARGVFHEVECAHDPERMYPLPHLVGDGRVNAKGIGCLYLATKEETAALEVRPLIGSFLSIGAFRIVRDLHIVDCSEKLIGNLARVLKRTPWTDQDIEKQVWTDINYAFSAPVERTDPVLDYVPTQVIAETLRLQGWDGIAYKSGYGEDGFNVALFDLRAAELLKCGLHRVRDMSVKLSMADNPYFLTAKGSVSNVATEVRSAASKKRKPKAAREKSE